MERQEWIQERKKSVGGSDAASILGLNPYSSPYAVWADKTGRLPEKPDNEAMRQGRDLEDYVARRWCEATGKRVCKKSGFIRNPMYPFAHANIDRKVIGERAGLECKTTSVLNLKKFKNGEYPENYYCQCVHYLAVTGYERWYLGVLVLNQGFYHYVIEREQSEIDALMDAEKNFWDYVEKDKAPPVDGMPATTETIHAVYSDSINKDSPIDLFGREDILNNFMQLNAEITALQVKKERLEQVLKSDLRENLYGACGNYVVSWIPQNRRKFDVKRYVSDHPGIVLDDYYNTSRFRKFEVKEKK